MQVNAMDATATTTIGATGERPSGAGSLKAMGLGRDAFLKLLVAGLRYQDPLSGSGGSGGGGQTDFISQLAQFSALEQMTELARWTRIVSGVGFIGKEITAVGPDGQEVTGLVTGFRNEGETGLLLVGDQTVPIDQVLQVRSAAAAAQTSQKGA